MIELQGADQKRRIYAYNAHVGRMITLLYELDGRCAIESTQSIADLYQNRFRDSYLGSGSHTRQNCLGLSVVFVTPVEQGLNKDRV
jgi:hypothetical protein